MKLYILIDEKGCIISSTRERILKEQIEVEMTDESETLNYKYVDGELVELTPEEKSEYYPEQSNISDIELLKAKIQAISDRNDFIEDCIAEMTMEVYQ